MANIQQQSLVMIADLCDLLMQVNMSEDQAIKRNNAKFTSKTVKLGLGCLMIWITLWARKAMNIKIALESEKYVNFYILIDI